MKLFKKIIVTTLCVSMAASSLSGCGKKTEDIKNESTGETVDSGSSETTNNEADKSGAATTVSGEVKYMERPALAEDYVIGGYDEELVPQVPEYSVAGEFSNVINSDIVSYSSQEFREKLAKNLFVVGNESGREFYETYEYNAYSQTPNFVTVDSMMHTYHLYFAHLLKNCEKTYLRDAVKSLSARMFASALENYEKLKGTEWEDAAVMEVEYFAVGCELIGENVDVPAGLSGVVDEEIDKIMEAGSIYDSAIFDDLMEDYSQYKPRGYYDDSEELKEYFRTMMWYGRMGFPTDNQEALRGALLITMSINNAGEEEWNRVYAVTSFFAGASDDMGYCEYLPIAEKVYGKVPDADALAGNDEAFENFQKLVSKLDPPQIQSVPVYQEQDNVINEFRFMGQRFTIDGSIMQNLIYRSVSMNENGDMRMLPDVMDIPAALGSSTAETIAVKSGASKFPDYRKKLAEVRSNLESASDTIWTSSLYAQWLNTLRPLLDKKGNGYPSFMTNEEWTKKTLETFAGSYTELKHDTVLYAKQPMAEMGGGWMEDIDDRGYVEPEPSVFERFARLSMATAKGLNGYNMISAEDMTNLERLSELAVNLMIISQKELRNELCTDEEYELIRNYGGDIEHFWYEAMKDEADSDYFTSEEYPAALVTDVATDPNGVVLEVGNGNPRAIYVVASVDGKLRICVGSAYNFYQFEWPLSDRLTDDKWREMIGAVPGEGYLYERDPNMDNPEWTKSYRAVEWDPSMWEDQY